MYDIALINIVIYQKSMYIYIELLARGRIKDVIEKRFDLGASYSDELLYNFLKPFVGDTPYYYIAMLDVSTQQGAIPTCKKEEQSRFIAASGLRFVCVDGSWSCYTSSEELKEQMEITGELGCDLIYSPFVILKSFFADKIKGSLALYLFVQEHSMTIAVFAQGRLLFGEYIDTRDELLPDEVLQFDDEEEDEEESIDLDDISLDDSAEETLDDDLDDLDSFGEIEELDSIDALDESKAEDLLEENLEAIAQEEQPKEEELEEDDPSRIERASEDFKRFSILQRTLSKYYEDERYESDFVETLYVADGSVLTKDFKRYVEDEMYLSVYVRKIEIELELCHLVKADLELVDV